MQTVTVTLHTADELVIGWKDKAAQMDTVNESVAHAYRICATELEALIFVAMCNAEPRDDIASGNVWPES